MDKPVADILDEAAALIEARGWTQEVHARDVLGHHEDVTPATAVCFCALGAISAAYGCNPDEEAGWDAQAALRNLLPMSIPDWNDAPDRTQAEVVAKLREAAALAREQAA